MAKDAGVERQERRDVLRGLGRTAAVFASVAMVGWTSCGFAADSPATQPATTDQPPQACNYSNLTPTDISFRQSLEYVELSPFGAAKDCRNCLSWVAPQGAYCGACSLMRGQVHPLGYCTSWDAA